MENKILKHRRLSLHILKELINEWFKAMKHILCLISIAYYDDNNKRLYNDVVYSEKEWNYNDQITDEFRWDRYGNLLDECK